MIAKDIATGNSAVGRRKRGLGRTIGEIGEKREEGRGHKRMGELHITT